MLPIRSQFISNVPYDIFTMVKNKFHHGEKLSSPW